MRTDYPDLVGDHYLVHFGVICKHCHFTIEDGIGKVVHI